MQALYNAEDAVIDARSLYEKAFRRRKGTNADRRGSGGSGGSGSNSGGAAEWFSSMGNTLAGVFGGTEEVALLAEALSTASGRLKVAKVRGTCAGGIRLQALPHALLR
jgi:hypothetical protein